MKLYQHINEVGLRTTPCNEDSSTVHAKSIFYFKNNGKSQLPVVQNNDMIKINNYYKLIIIYNYIKN